MVNSCLAVGGWCSYLVRCFLGYLAGRLLKCAENKHTIERFSFLGYTIALSPIVLGAAKLRFLQAFGELTNRATFQRESPIPAGTTAPF